VLIVGMNNKINSNIKTLGGEKQSHTMVELAYINM